VRRSWFVVSCFFFFSSRRRHTSFSRDWSSDVCSSDLTTANRYADAVPWEVLRSAVERDVRVDVVMNRIPPREGVAEELAEDLREIGRASCRERVSIAGGAG